MTQLNPAEQKEVFVKALMDDWKKQRLVSNEITFVNAMKKVQSDREREAGGHTWKVYTRRYGPQIIFAEIASITSRIEALIWKKSEDSLTAEQKNRLRDLTVDLGNYTSFLFDWIQERIKT